MKFNVINQLMILTKGANDYVQFHRLNTLTILPLQLHHNHFNRLRRHVLVGVQFIGEIFRQVISFVFFKLEIMGFAFVVGDFEHAMGQCHQHAVVVMAVGFELLLAGWVDGGFPDVDLVVGKLFGAARR